jgi:predicted membrane-bound dolichyl-phosphate-mannose-protein mannosyltransferase
MAPNMKLLQRTLLMLLVSITGVLFYANRALLTSTYDAIYWKDRFEHSQWQLPLSPRTIGDNGLYAYEGYQLASGMDPTKYNAEIPPLGKYVIGAVIAVSGNGSWYGVATSMLMCILFFILTKKALKNTLLALAATTWLASDPLLVSQWPATMLDSLHLASLLLFFILLEKSVRRKQTILSIAISGIALGIFSSIKYPIFSVILFAAAQYYIWRKTQSICNAITFCLAAFLTYLVFYARYFLLGHTFLEWLGVQKWMFTFWYNGQLEANVGSVWTTLLVNRYQNLFTNLWGSVSEWSAAWPVITILSGYVVFRFIRRKKYRKSSWEFIMGTSVIAIMLVYTIISFWTRYLLIILPFLYLGAATAIRTLKNKALAVVCILGIVLLNGYASWHIIFRTPEADVQQFMYDWKNGFFQDMYERFTIGAKAKTDRYVFLQTMQKFMRDGEIESADITIPSVAWQQFSSPQYIDLGVTYHTRNLGWVSQTIRLPVVNENGQWRIPWQMNYFIPGLAPGDTLKTTVIPAKRGSIIDGNGQILAGDVPGFMIWVTPKLVDTTKEQAMLQYLETIFGGLPRFSAVNFYHRYSVNSQPDRPVPIGVLPLTQPIQSGLLSYPGISLTPATGRYETAKSGLVGNTHFTECCSYLYTTTTYDGISGLEKTYNEKLKGQNGGSLVIINNTGQIMKTLIENNKIDGENVSL